MSNDSGAQPSPPPPALASASLRHQMRSNSVWRSCPFEGGALGEREGALDRPRAARRALDVDADLGALGQRDHGQIGGVREVEAQRRARDLGLAVLGAGEFDVAGMHAEPAREDDPQRGAGHDPARCGGEPRGALALLRSDSIASRERTSSGGWDEPGLPDLDGSHPGDGSCNTSSCPSLRKDD